MSQEKPFINPYLKQVGHLNNKMPDHTECNPENGNGGTLGVMCQENNEDVFNLLDQKNAQAISLTGRMLESILEDPSNFSNICREGKKQQVIQLLEFEKSISAVMTKLLYDENYISGIPVADYLDILKVILDQVYENQLPIATEEFENHVIRKMQETIKIEDITENKLLKALRETGSLDALCSDEISTSILTGLENKATELGMNPLQLTEWFVNLLDKSSNHERVNRDLFARVPLILIQTQWQKVRAFCVQYLPQYERTSITDLGNIAYTQEFNNLPVKLKGEYYTLMREMRKPLLQAGYYMSTFLNQEQSNFDETQKVFILLEDLAQDPEFKEVERINAKNNRIAILLNNQATLSSPETAANLHNVFLGNGHEILNSCESMFNIPSSVEQGSLTDLVNYIADTVFDYALDPKQHPEFKQYILPITTYLNMFVIASRKTALPEEEPQIEGGESVEMQTMVESLLKRQSEYLEKLMEENEKGSKEEARQFRNEFASSHCELLTQSLDLNNQSDLFNYVHTTDYVCRICGIHYPNSMLNQLLDMSEQLNENLESVNDVVEVTHAAFCSKDRLALTKLKNYIGDTEKSLESKDQALDYIVKTLNHILSITLKEFDENTFVHSENVSHTVAELMEEFSQIVNLDPQDPHAPGWGILEEYVAVLGGSMEVLHQEFLDYFADGLFTETVQSCIRGAELHDIGKVGILSTVLLEPGKLNDEQFDIMKKHTQYSQEILAEYPDQIVRETAQYHHEKWGGGGYRGMIGEDIPVSARITAVADVWNALTENRVYTQDYAKYSSQEIFVKGAAVFLFDSNSQEKFKHFCPFLQKIMLARVGINAEKLAPLVADTFKYEDVIADGKLIQSIDWNHVGAKKEIERINKMRCTDYSPKTQQQVEIAKIYNLTNQMGLNENYLHKIINLWTNIDSKQDEPKELQKSKTMQAKAQFKNSIDAAENLNLGYSSIRALSHLQINDKTVEIMFNTDLSKNRISEIHIMLEEIGLSIQEMLTEFQDYYYSKKDLPQTSTGAT